MGKINLNDDWWFSPEFKGCHVQTFCPEKMQKVRLPHSVTETPFSYFDESCYEMISAYQKQIFVPPEWHGRVLLLTFEGVAHSAVVFCNGVKVSSHSCGYTAFEVDLTDYVRYGEENLITVRVDSRETQNIPPFGYVIDYMTYGGIYREVYLTVKSPEYLKSVFVFSEIQTKDITVGGERAGSAELVTRITISDAAGQGTKNLQDTEKEKNPPFTIRQFIRRVDEGEYRELSITSVKKEDYLEYRATVPEVLLWHPEHPVLYQIKTGLYAGNDLLDVHRVRMGFRRAEFAADGFYLNGQKCKIRGLNRHQSYPYVGYAMPESMQKLDADILKKELGLNAVRTSHYPQSHHFLNRCDEIGLLVFTEIPGWQHIGNEEWKEQAVQNTADMVVQYRNHTSIVLWGVRINESADDDAFYERTNEVAHRLDPTRATGGVRAHAKSSLLEDVYTYNDFSHDGVTAGCRTKKSITPDQKKAYLISEYNGHMYPTKSYDTEENRREHALRHARVLNQVMAYEDIAGSFGWCMFDYNTHKDFGSGDRICHHGVMDMFRNPKQAAAVYAAQQSEIPVLSVSSSMDIGEHPACNRGDTWIYSNADSIKTYKNGRFLKTYVPENSPMKHLPHGPVRMDDFIGDALNQEGCYKKGQAKGLKDALNATAIYGLSHLPKSVYLILAKLVFLYHMKPTEAVAIYNKYIGDWGGSATSYRFEAVKEGKVVAVSVKEPVRKVHLRTIADHTKLREEATYDVALVRIQAVDQNENVLPFFQEPVQLICEGAIALIGPSVISLKGGMGGTYVKTTGAEGCGTLIIRTAQAEEVRIVFEVSGENVSEGQRWQSVIEE